MAAALVFLLAQPGEVGAHFFSVDFLSALLPFLRPSEDPGAAPNLVDSAVLMFPPCS